MIQAAQEATDPGTLVEVGAVFTATSLALVPLAIVLVERIHPGRNVYFARWGFSHLALVAALGTVLLLAASFLDPWLGGLEPTTRTLAVLALRGGVLLGCCGAVASFARRLDPAGVRALGLGSGRHLRAAGAGLVAYAIVLPGLFGLGWVWPWLLDALGQPPVADPLLEQLVALDPGQRVIAIFFGVAVIPLLEEILFRAFLQPLLVQNLSDRLGIVATSFIFAALHGTTAFVPIFALSLLLGGIMLRTQRLGAVWAVHAAHNGLVFLLLYR